MNFKKLGQNYRVKNSSNWSSQSSSKFYQKQLYYPIEIQQKKQFLYQKKSQQKIQQFLIQCNVNNGLQQQQTLTNNSYFQFEIPNSEKNYQLDTSQQFFQAQNCVLDPNKIPNHIAIIMDGNSRWGKKRGLSVMEGHRAGADALLRTVQSCLKFNKKLIQSNQNNFSSNNNKNNNNEYHHSGIKVLSVFAFSLENLERPPLEVQFLFQLFEQVLEHETQKLEQQGVRIKTFGDLSVFPITLQNSIKRAEERSKDNQQLVLNVGFGYGARQDIVSAAKKLAKQTQQGLIKPEDIDEQLFKQNLSFGECEFGSPDLLIRTSGEKRISNFLLWECAYTEMVFIKPYWPDFNESILQECIHEFGQRQRRYGKRQQQQQ